MKKKYTIGVDLGGTNIKVALVDNQGNIINKIKAPTRVVDGPDKIIDRVIILITELMKSVSPDKLNGIGIGAAGEVDHQEGKIWFSPNLFWKNVPLVAKIKKKINLPVILENDANAAAWYMHQLGPAKGVDNLICVTLGTGVGGGIIINNKIYHGWKGKAGEIGHMTLFSKGLKCNCGNYGCLERYVGASYIVERAVKKIKKGEKSIIKDKVSGDWSKVTPRLLEKAARQGDKLSKEIWAETGEYLGIILASVSTLLDLEMIVICGGISKAGEVLFDSLKDTLKKRVFGKSPGMVRLVHGKLKEDAGVIGASLLYY
ncbi:ROK family protein [bacterium]|nr:ROK family protein [bacterium]